VDYADKLAEIFASNDIPSVKVVRMQVPCCAALERAVTQAIAKSQKNIPLEAITLSIQGDVLKAGQKTT